MRPFLQFCGGRLVLDLGLSRLEERAAGLAVLVDAGLELLEGEDWGQLCTTKRMKLD